MDTSKVFDHKGTVEEIRDNLVRIRMKVTDACGACSAKRICGSVSSGDRILEIPNSGQQFMVGDEVDVVIKQSAGLKAVLIGYVNPAVLLILSLFLVIKLTHNESMAALVSIGSLIFYFLILYSFRNIVKKKISFTLRKTGT